MKNLRYLFEKNGFAIIKEVLSQNETKLLRNHILTKFKSTNTDDSFCI